MKKKLCYVGAVLIIFTIFCSKVICIDAMEYYMLVQEDNGRYKVLIGQDKGTELSPNAYAEKRIQVLHSLDENKKYSAVILFNDFYSTEEVLDILEQKNLEVTKIFAGSPMSFSSAQWSLYPGVKVKPAIEQCLKQAVRAGQVKREDVGVYAITISADVKELQNMQNQEMVRLVDVNYSPEIEELALENDKRVTYIELPSLPYMYIE